MRESDEVHSCQMVGPGLMPLMCACPSSHACPCHPGSAASRLAPCRSAISSASYTTNASYQTFAVREFIRFISNPVPSYVDCEIWANANPSESELHICYLCAEDAPTRITPRERRLLATRSRNQTRRLIISIDTEEPYRAQRDGEESCLNGPFYITQIIRCYFAVAST